MHTFWSKLLTIGIVVATTHVAFAAAPTPTPAHDHKHPITDQSETSPASATLAAELAKPARPAESNRPLAPRDRDTGGLDDVGNVGGDFEE